MSFGSNTNAKHITTWFRKAFTVVEKRDIRGLSLSVLRDDGAVLYLNGGEVFRSNMPEGPITAATPALVAVGGAEENTFFSVFVNPALLTDGLNLLAAEVHQSSGSSTDLSFEAELRAVVATPPTMRAAWAPATLRLSWPASVQGYVVETATSLNPPVMWQLVTNTIGSQAGQNVVVISNGFGEAGFFRLRRP